MEIKWEFLNWLVPLVAGGGLTFGFGALDSRVKFKRETKSKAAETALAIASKRRDDAREHALRALTVASQIRDRVSQRPGVPGEPLDLYDTSGVPWDPDEIRELRDVGILIPDEIVREVIGDASYFVTASSMVADGVGWELSPREAQIQAMSKLREVLGSYLRGEPADAEIVAWFRRLSEALSRQWAELDELSRRANAD